jgi:hypothetical protein
MKDASNTFYIFSSPCQGNVSLCHHLASVFCRPLNFHILIFTSETPQPNELKLGRKHLESGFRGEDFLEINQSERRMACGVHVC